MKTERLPITLEPVKLAKAGRSIQGLVQLSEMTRLSEALFASGGEAAVSMDFHLDEEGHVVIDLTVKSLLPLGCQRCLSAYEHSVDMHQSMSPVTSPEEAERLPSHLEPFLLVGDFIETSEFIEESLLLEVPIVPMHDSEDCQGAPQTQKAEEVGEVQQRENPFAVLAGLKETLENES